MYIFNWIFFVKLRSRIFDLNYVFYVNTIDEEIHFIFKVSKRVKTLDLVGRIQYFGILLQH